MPYGKGTMQPLFHNPSETPYTDLVLMATRLNLKQTASLMQLAQDAVLAETTNEVIPSENILSANGTAYGINVANMIIRCYKYHPADRQAKMIMQELDALAGISYSYFQEHPIFMSTYFVRGLASGVRQVIQLVCQAYGLSREAILGLPERNGDD